MIIAAIFLVILIIGVPVAFTLGLTAMAYISFQTSLPPLVAFQRMFASVDSFPFMAIPFFMLAGNLMGASGLAHRIIDLARALVGHLRGGSPTSVSFPTCLWAAYPAHRSPIVPLWVPS